MSLIDFTAPAALAAVKVEVDNFGYDFGKFDMLMRIVPLQVDKLIAPTGAGLGADTPGFSGLQHLLPVTLVPFS
jgi:hypothetical protein